MALYPGGGADLPPGALGGGIDFPTGAPGGGGDFLGEIAGRDGILKPSLSTWTFGGGSFSDEVSSD